MTDLEMFSHLSRPYAKLYPIVSRLKQSMSFMIGRKEVSNLGFPEDKIRNNKGQEICGHFQS